MNSQELETAIRLKLNLTIIILNDSGYGMIKWKQQNMNFKNFGLDFNNPDFVKYAQSYGAYGYQIKKQDNFKEKVNEIINMKGIKIFDVPIDYSNNKKVLFEDLKKINCKK